jgi:hypothetical protein
MRVFLEKGRSLLNIIVDINLILDGGWSSEIFVIDYALIEYSIN